MPNWCYTSMTITTKTSEDADRLMTALTAATSKRILPDQPQYFGHRWLGNLLNYIGMTEDDISKVECRGEIEDFSRDRNFISVYLSTAWSPQFAALQKFLDYLKVEPKEIFYTAEEFGCDLFVTNDPDGIDTYYLSTDNDNWYDLTEEGLRATLIEEYGEHPEILTLPVDDLISWAYDEFDDVCIHRCEYEPFETWV